MTKLFISGLFRSGTTFLARALNAHPEMSVASDPYFEFWKALRNKWFAAQQADFNTAQPLSDYFEADSSTTERFWDELWTLEFHPTEWKHLGERVAAAAAPYSPKIAEHWPLVGNPIAATDAVELLYQTILAAYPTANARCIGAKEVWTDEFIGPFLDRFDLAGRALHIVRDPRAVIASNRKSSTGAYPVLFLVRQWRKSVQLAQQFEGRAGYLRMRYEDIIADPETAFRQICDHAMVSFDASLLDGSNYVDGAGEPWQQNSSHGTSSTINAQFVERWRSVLPPHEVQLIEWLCGPEMDFMGYARQQIDFPAAAVEQFKDDYPNIADWIKPYNFNLTPAELERELNRQSLAK